MRLWETVMNWLGFTRHRNTSIPTPHYLEEEHNKLNEELRNATAVSSDISKEIAKVSDQQVKRTEDIKVVMSSIQRRIDPHSVVRTAEEALDILNRAGRR